MPQCPLSLSSMFLSVPFHWKGKNDWASAYNEMRRISWVTTWPWVAQWESVSMSMTMWWYNGNEIDMNWWECWRWFEKDRGQLLIDIHYTTLSLCHEANSEETGGEVRFTLIIVIWLEGIGRASVDGIALPRNDWHSWFLLHLLSFTIIVNHLLDLLIFNIFIPILLAILSSYCSSTINWWC